MNTLARRCAIGGLWLSCAACGSADEIGSVPLPQARLAAADSIVAEWVDSGRIPGAVLVVTHLGEVVHEKAFGYAQLYDYGSGQYPTSTALSPPPTDRLDTPVRMTVETVFDLASVTKVMATTMAMMLLVDRGRVDLDAPVSQWLPAFGAGERSGITPRMLLAHTSGLPPWWPTYYHGSTPTEIWAWMDTIPLHGPPGLERRYSDLGFMTLGRIVESVAGVPLDRFVEAEIYAPLGLATTGFRRGGEGAGSVSTLAATSHGNPFERRMVHDPDFGYRIDIDPDSWDGWRARTLIGEVNDGNAWHSFNGVAGHAGLFSNAPDLAVLVAGLLREGRWGDQPFIQPETVRAFMTGQVEGQALGWQLPSYAPEGAWAHTGFTGTFVLGLPRDELGIVLLTNKQNLGVDEDTGYTDVGPLNRAVTSALTGSD